MARSSRSIRRLVDLFRDLETLERAKVSELARQSSELKAAQEELLASLANPSPQTEPFLGLMSRSIGQMDRRLQRLRMEHEAAIQRYTQAAARTKGAADRLSVVKADEDRKAEQRQLEDLLEFQQSTTAQVRCKSTGSS